MNPDEIKAEILRLTAEFYRTSQQHLPRQEKVFVPGKDTVQYAGRVYDEQEMIAAVSNMLDFWLTAGPAANTFEKEFAKYLGVKYSLIVNSGSSANLLAMSCLTSPSLEDKLVPGDEVITVAAAFPTTVAPIVLCGLVPVYVDIELGTYNLDVSKLPAAISSKTRAIFVAHTLGNPFNLDAVLSFAEEHNLYVIEDNCDALGSTWNGKLTGTFGDVGTVSFFPAHHITAGEGGAVFTSNSRLYRALQSLRGWGRDCWCEPGVSNTCGKRFGWSFEGLPSGYDHKNIYTHVGYNLKPLDVQAAILIEQLKKLPDFIDARRRNFQSINEAFKRYEDKFILPQHLPQAEPSWFGYLVTVKSDAGFTRDEIVRHFEAAKIETRPLFAGNLVRHPAYSSVPHRVVGNLENSDYVMNNTFWVGVYSGLTDDKINYIRRTLDDFMENIK